MNGSPLSRTPKDEVTLPGAIAIGIGGMVGGGIFAVLGEAISLAHGATHIAFAIAGLLALLTAYSYAKLSVAFPSKGGTVVFFDKAFGTNLFSGSLNLVLWLSYLVTMALYATAFASYAQTFLPPGLPAWGHHALISSAIIFPVILNLFSSELISRAETIVVAVKLILLGLIISAGMGHLEMARLAPSNWAAPAAIIPAGMVIFVAYEGFELIANAAENIRNPARTLPRAYFGSVGIVIALYILVAIVTVGAVPEHLIASAKDYVLAEAARPSLGQFGFTLVAVAALLATLSAINATIYGSARLGFTLAKDKELPDIFERKVWNEPLGVFIVGSLTLCEANLLNVQDIAIIASAGFLLIFALVNYAGFRLADQIGASRVPTALGSAACFAALGTLLYHAYRQDRVAFVLFVAFLLLSVLFERVFALLHRKRHLAKSQEVS